MATNVTRKVDTVIVEMDISTAEMLAEVLMTIQDNTMWGNHHTGEYGIGALRSGLLEDAEVRYPSALYRFSMQNGYPELRDTTPTEMNAICDARHRGDV